MKTNYLKISKNAALVASLFLAIGCGKDENSNAANPATNNPNKPVEVKPVVIGNPNEVRADFEKSTETQISGIKNQLSLLKRIKDKEDSKEIQEAYDKRLSDIKASLETTQNKYSDFKKVPDTLWKDNKEPVTKALDETTEKLNKEVGRQAFETELRETLQTIRAKSDALKEDVKQESVELRQKLDQKYDELKPKFDELRAASAEKWEQTKDTVKDAGNDIKEGFKDLFNN